MISQFFEVQIKEGQINRYLDFRADYGFQLIKNQFLNQQIPADNTSSHGYLSVVLKF